MIRIVAAVASMSILAGCTGGAAVRPGPGSARTGEWRQLPAETAGPAGIALENVRTKAVVTVTFMAAGRPILDVVGAAALRLAANGADVDDPVLAADGRRAGFAWSMTGSAGQVRGRVTVKSLDPPRPLAIVVGVWPAGFDEEMARDFEAIVNGVNGR